MIGEYLSTNEHRNYPFKDDALLLFSTPSAGIIRFPNDCILDVQVIDYSYNVDFVRMFRVQNIGGGVLLFSFDGYFFNEDYMTIRYDLTFDISVSTAGVFPMTVSGQTADYSYTVVFGPGVSSLCNTGGLMENTGLYLATAPYPFVESTLATLTNTKATSIIGTAAGSVALTSNDIALEAGYNVDISINQSDNSVTINASPGAGIGVDCSPPILAVGRCDGAVMQINGAVPDASGNINIQGGNYVTVTTDPVNHEVIIESGIESYNPTCGETK